MNDYAIQKKNDNNKLMKRLTHAQMNERINE